MAGGERREMYKNNQGAAEKEDNEWKGSERGRGGKGQRKGEEEGGDGEGGQRRIGRGMFQVI